MSHIKLELSWLPPKTALKGCLFLILTKALCGLAAAQSTGDREAAVTWGFPRERGQAGPPRLTVDPTAPPRLASTVASTGQVHFLREKRI